MRRTIARTTVGLAISALLASSVAANPAAHARGPTGAAPVMRPPLGFEANVGQADRSVRFLSRNNDSAVFATTAGVTFVFGQARAARPPSAVRMTLLGSTPSPRIDGLDRLPGTVNDLRGEDPARWHVGIPTFGRIRYHSVYRGIDLILHGDRSGLEYDFALAPGARPQTIGLAFEGARRVELSRAGELILHTDAGEVRQAPPFVYQENRGRRRRIPAAFTLDGGRVGFRVGSYDRNRPLVIDPVLDYSTFLGGATGYDAVNGITVDDARAAYVAGYTFSADFPVTTGAFDPNGSGPSVCAPAQDPASAPPPDSACASDAFVSKISSDGKLIYSTFLGGSSSDRAADVAIDELGSAYVVGGTDSADFPVTPGAADPTFAGSKNVIGLGLVVLSEAFVAKLSPDGTRLVYSTYLGGSAADEGWGIELDAAEAAYVVGSTFSRDFPTTAGAYDRVLNTPSAPGASTDAFVAKVAPPGTQLDYATYNGGSRFEFGFDIAVDDQGSAYATGDSTSADFPTTAGAFRTTPHVHPETAASTVALEEFADADAWVTKLSPDGSSAVYSTLIGGTGHEHGHGIVVREREAYVSGHTFSRDFPTTPGAFDRTFGGSDSIDDGWVAKIRLDGGSLAFATYVGGRGSDFAMSIALGDDAAPFITGMTTSVDFPTTPDALDKTYVGPEAVPGYDGLLRKIEGVDPGRVYSTHGPFYDAYIAELTPDGGSMRYASYLGGVVAPDVGSAIAVRGTSVYVAGFTFAPDFPTSKGSIGPLFHGPLTYSDGFVSKFTVGSP